MSKPSQRRTKGIEFRWSLLEKCQFVRQMSHSGFEQYQMVNPNERIWGEVRAWLVETFGEPYMTLPLEERRKVIGRGTMVWDGSPGCTAIAHLDVVESNDKLMVESHVLNSVIHYEFHIGLTASIDVIMAAKLRFSELFES